LSCVIVYASSSECYREVMSSRRLDDCNALWTRVSDALSNVSAYQFYCQRDDIKRHQLITSVASLPLIITTISAASLPFSPFPFSPLFPLLSLPFSPSSPLAKARGSGGASAVKKPGHFEVRKSSSQVTRMHFFPQKS